MHRIQRSVGELLGGGALPAVAPSEPVSAAIRAMKETGAAAALVMEADRLVGIFTERDLLLRVAGAGLLDSTPTAEVMTRGPVTLQPGDCVTWAINRLAFHGFSNLPIVEDGRVVGLLGIRDVLAHLSEVFRDLEAPDEDDGDDDVGGG